MFLTVPARLAANCRGKPERAAWLARLPEALRELERRWSLSPGAPLVGDEASCAWVAPVVLPGGTPAVLKLAMPHMEGGQEIDGLRFWNGNPTVRLLEASDEIGAMLLERCDPGAPLRSLPEAEQDVVVAALLRRLWRSPASPHSFRPLSVLVESWNKESVAQSRHWPDAGLVREGLRLLNELSRAESYDALLATDLHAGNILSAQRERWLLIDPKPFAGDPAYDATQHLLNCERRMQSDPHGTIRRVADLLAVDDGRVRAWMFGRTAAEPRADWQDRRLMDLARALAPN